MRAIAAFPETAEPGFVAAPAPQQPGPGEVLCRTLELGVCGTDREILSSQQPWTPPGCEHLVLGHECLGEVCAVGEGAADLKVGDLVVPVVRRALDEAEPRRVDMLPMGTYTERGIAYQHGFSAPYWIDLPQHLLKIDPALREVAVLAEPLTVSEKGVNEAQLLQQARLGEDAWTAKPPRVLVTGMGPIGFGSVIASVCRGWPTTVYGRDPEDSFRCEQVRRLGADYLPQGQAGFPPADVEADGFDLILECTGAEEVIVETSQALASCGVMAWLGSQRRPQPKNLNLAAMIRWGLLRNHLHIGCVNAALRDFEDSLAHLYQMQQEFPGVLNSLITARVSPEKSLWHYSHREPQGIKTVLMYES